MTTLPEEGSAVPVSDERSLSDAANDVLEQAAAAVDPLGELADFAPLDNQRRLLLVHAHPDDETLWTGGTIARYAAEGALVALVTCTRGEEGEVVAEDLAALRSDPERLAEHRVEELATACEALRCTEHRYLGGPGRWVDSGMRPAPDGSGLGPTSADPRALARAGAERDSEAVAELVAVVREIRPQVVVSYAPDGGYGHPDHVAAAALTVAAVEAAGDPAYRPDVGVPWAVAKRYETVLPRGVVVAALQEMRDGHDGGFVVPDAPEQVAHVVEDTDVTTTVDVGDHTDAVVAALRAHRTQVSVAGGTYALSHGRGMRVLTAEHYVLAAGRHGGGVGPDGREDDLFAGVRT